MDTTTDRGLSSDEYVLHTFDGSALNLFETSVRYWLHEQPTSLHPLATEDYMIEQIKRGLLFGLLITENSVEVGLALFSIREYPKGMVFNVEFLSCKNFYKMATGWEALVNLAQQYGFSYIEAIAHPTIATYAVEKKGFGAPNVHIIKSIHQGRIN